MIIITSALNDFYYLIVMIKRGYMSKRINWEKRTTRIAGYSFLIVAVFIVSLFVIPFKFFFISAAFVLIALREVEKELHKSDYKSVKFIGKKTG